VAVIGGGVVACEATTWLLGLGVEELTMMVRGSTLLARNEPFAGQLVADRLTRLGARIMMQASADRVDRADVRDTGVGRVHGGPVTLTLGGDSVVVDEVVVATGRTPSTADLGLASVGLTPRGFLTTDDHLAVTGVAGEWLYAVGDVTGRALLTHMGKYHGRICGAVIGARAEGRPLDGSHYRSIADHDRVPQVAFAEPEVASVGLTEAAAREKGFDVETVEYDLGAVAGASLLRDGYTGRAKLVIDRPSDTLVGATFVGPEVAELLHAATTAIVGRVTLDTLWHVVPSYPTVSEIWLRLLEARAQRPAADGIR
jgi:pyruvate/2-oxoglutarate dehydrogenase complex dihydrolipoamide dehydrogenase (E3) component